MTSKISLESNLPTRGKQIHRKAGHKAHPKFKQSHRAGFSPMPSCASTAVSFLSYCACLASEQENTTENLKVLREGKSN